MRKKIFTFLVIILTAVVLVACGKTTYEVSFDVAGGTPEISTVKVEEGKLVSEPTAPTRDGYELVGWFLDGEEWVFASDKVTKNITLVAQWEEDVTEEIYTVTFKIPGENDVIKTQKFGTPLVAPTPAGQTGHDFVWDVEVPTTMPAEDMIITGQYVIKSYSIKYMVDGEVYGELESYNYGAPITIRVEPTIVGYTFSGWDKEIPSTMPAEDMVINGTYTINNYTITFNIEDADPVIITQDYNTPITEPTYAVREGYTFSWDKEIPSTMPAEDMVINGTYTINKYTITFVTPGEETKEFELDYNAAVTAPTYQAREGYTFAWVDEVPTNMPARDVTINGLFTIITYSVKFYHGEDLLHEIPTDYLELVDMPENPTRDGYKFVGWFTDAAFANEFDANTQIKQDYNLYAKFNLVNLTVEIDGVKYESLQEAVTAAKSGDFITLLADASGDGVIAPENSSFTLDLNGKTYTVDGTLVGSTGTETNGFQLLKGSTITIKNGTITTPNETGAKILIQNYSNLTLDNVELVGADVTQYVLSNNFGSTKLENGTTITAVTDQVAFDVYYGLSAAYDAGVSVTIADANVVITGAYEYGKAGRVTDENWYEKATLIIAKDHTLAAPEGFKWVTNTEGNLVLTKPKTVAVSAISVSPETLTLTAGGATGTITATVEPSGATNKTVTWTSSDEAVATVAGGVVTPLTVGTTTITATTVDGGFTATTTVTVEAPSAVDKAALTEAITAANTNKGTVEVSADGTDVDPANKWVTTEVMTAYTDAIAAAQTIADKADATQTEVDDAVTALGTATSTFDGAKADGTKPAAVNKAALTAAITAANTNKGTATVSTDGTDVDPANKWVTTEVMTAYTEAIAAAQAVADKEDATQAEVDAAVTALATATGTFNGAKKAGTKVAVEFGVTSVEKGNTLVIGTGTDVYYNPETITVTISGIIPRTETEIEGFVAGTNLVELKIGVDNAALTARLKMKGATSLNEYLLIDELDENNFFYHFQSVTSETLIPDGGRYIIIDNDGDFITTDDQVKIMIEFATDTKVVEGTRSVLLDKLEEEFKKIDVAEVELNKETDDITVTFAEDVAIDAVETAANDLIDALRQIVDGTSTLTIKGKEFTLSEVTASQLALAILDGQSASGFLKAGVPIKATYTASVDYKNAKIELGGTVSFEVEGTKAALLDKLEAEFNKINVADVVLDKTTDDITVTFAEDVAIDAVETAANDLIDALRQIVDGTSTLTIKGKEFTLSEVTASQLALAILDGQSASGFLKAGVPIKATYTASVDYKNAKIELGGTVSFEVEGTKAALLDKLEAEFNKINVADVVLDKTTDDITVTFAEDVAIDAVETAANDLIDALRQIVDGTSTLTIKGKEFTLSEVTASQLALAILDGQSASGFLKAGVPIKATYTASVDYKNAKIELGGTVSFEVEGTKAALLDKLEAEFNKINVADVVLDKTTDDITVTFAEDVAIDAVETAANDLIDALRQIVDGTSTLTIKGKEFTLSEVTASQLALAILDGQSASGFLKAGVPIKATYTASVDYKNAKIELGGTVSFEVEGTKAALLDKLEAEFNKINVADVVLDKTTDDITVTFAEDVAIDAVETAANDLIDALRQIVDGTSTLTIKGKEFTLSEVTASQLALAILDGQSASGFLKAGVPIKATYTASVDYKNAKIELGGTVSFEVEGTKAALLDKLEAEFNKINVADVVLDKTTDDITVTFAEDVAIDAVETAANDLIDALRQIVDGTSTLTIKGKEFTLSEVTASQLALAILDGQSASGFLKAGVPIKATYTASVDYKNAKIELGGTVSFEVEGTKAALLDKLEAEFNKINVADVVLDKTTDDITVTFAEDVAIDAVETAANDLIDALRQIVDGTSTLTIKGKEFTLSEVTASQLALAILDGQSASGFLKAGVPIKATYTASVDYKNAKIELGGTVSFEVEGTKAALLDKLEAEFNKINVADVVLDKTTDDITVTFAEDVAIDAVETAANDLIDALRQIVDGTSTLTIKGKEFTLSEVTASQLALAILDGQSASGFLKAGVPIKATYTASVDYKNAKIELGGTVSFEVEGTKAALLDKLEAEFNKINVADVVLDKTTDDITVTFAEDVAIDAVETAANDLIDALRQIVDGTSTLTIKGKEFTLSEVTASQLALAILDGQSASGFLKAGVPIKATYTASVDYKNAKIELGGTVSFEVEGTKAALLDKLEAEFNKINVADVVLDKTTDDITVTFAEDVAIDAVETAANDLIDALRQIVDGTSTLTIKGKEFTLSEVTASQLALAILDGQSASGFLKAGVPIKATYTASVDYKNAKIELGGTVSFEVEGTKAALLDKLEAEFNKINVADVVLDKTTDDITVTFAEDVAIDAVETAANDLIDALRQIVDGTSTLTIKGKEFTLSEVTASQLALAILDGQSASGFLKAGVPIKATYTASVDYKNAKIELGGTVSFEVEGTKAALLDKLEAEFNKINVADVVLDKTTDDITVTFAEDVAIDAVETAANDLIDALRQIVDGTSTLTIKGKEFTLSEVTASQLALAILDGQSASEFLEAGVAIKAEYTASVDYKNAKIELGGTVSFEVEGTKAALLDKLEAEFNKINVADVVLDKTTDDITVTFAEDVAIDAVETAANDLIDALRQIVDGTSTLTIKGKEFTLSEVTASQLALAILDGQSASGFLKAGVPIKATYTASVDYKNAKIELGGTVSFEVEGTKAALLDKLEAEFNKIDVAEVELDKSTENINITFVGDVYVSDVEAVADQLLTAIRLFIDSSTSTLNVGSKEFKLETVTANQLASAIIGEKDPSALIIAGDSIVVSYVASVDYKNAIINLNGYVSLTITKASYDMTNASFEDASYTYDGNEKELLISGTLPVGVEVTYTENKLTDAGSLEVTAIFTGSSNYEDISSLTAILTINPLEITITPEAGQSKVYGDDDPVLTYTHTDLIGEDKLTGALGREAGEDVGTYAITQGDLALPNANYTLSFVDRVTFEITKATYDMSNVSFGNASYTYDGSEKELLISGTLPAGVEVSYTANKLTDAGSLEVTASFMGSSNYEDISSLTATLTINPLEITVTADGNQSKVYGETDPVLTYTNTTLIGEDKLTGALGREAGEDVGTYAITQGDLALPNANYTLSFVDRVTFEITKATYDMTNVSFDDASYTYDGNEKELLISGTLPVGVEVTYTANKLTNAGSIEVTALFTGSPNYEDIPSLTATLTITSLEITVTPDAGQSKIYGDADPIFTYTHTALIGDDELTGALGRETGEDVGPYAITIGDLAASTNNYALKLAAETVNFEIKNALIAGVTLVDQDITYDGELHSIEVTAVPEGATVTYVVDGVDQSDIPSYKDVGEYLISVRIELENHETLTLSATLTVTKRPITITIDNKSSDRTKDLQALSYQVTSGTIIEGDDLGIILSTDANKGVSGSYAITGTSSNTNYDVTFIEGTYYVKFEVVFWNGTVRHSIKKVNEGDLVERPTFDPNKDNHDFAGWYTTKEYDELFDFNTTIKDDLNLYAKFDIHTYQVIFKDHDETILKEETVAYGASATPPADPKREGYTFAGWDKDYSYIKEEITIYPIYFDSNAIARIGSEGYERLESALEAAKSGDTVILLQDYTLQSNITIPEDVTLLLPISTTDTGYLKSGAGAGFNPDGTSTSKGDLSELYLTLSIPEGHTMTVNGTVMVNSVTGRPAAGHYDQDITGPYSQIGLNGKILVNSGGLLDVFGKVTGTGLVEALSGGSVGDLYVVRNWRGGSQAATVYLDSDAFPYNEYDMHNIEADVKINSGASFYGNVKMYADSKYWYTRFYQVDQTNGLIKLAENATFNRIYDSINQQSYITINGGAEEIGGSMTIASMGVTTTDRLFPIDGDIHFRFENGFYEINNQLKFLPGSTLEVASNATLQVASAAQLILYQEFIDAPNTGDTQYPIRDAVEFRLAGTLDIQGAFGGYVDPEGTKIIIGPEAKLSVSSEEAHGYTGTSDFKFETYIVNLTLGVNTETSQAIWHSYPNDGTPEDSVLIDPMYEEAVEYFDLSPYTQTYLNKTLFLKEYDYAAAKATAKGELEAALGTYNKTDYSTENWAALNTAKTDGDAAIEVATDLAGIESAKEAALAAMDKVKTAAAETAEALTVAKALIDGKSVEVAYSKGKDKAVVLAAIKALDETNNALIQALTEDDIEIVDGKATVTFAEGVIAEVSVTEAPLQEMTGTVAITGVAEFGATLIADISDLTNVGTPTYQWNRDEVAIPGATKSTYTLVKDDIGKTITVDVTADNISGKGTITSEATGLIAKATATPPAAPEVSDFGQNYVRLVYDNSLEFSKDEGNWQENNYFGGLNEGTSYTFYARVKETDTHLASLASPGTTVTTLIQLGQVQKPKWGKDAITWDSVPNASHYGVWIFMDGITQTVGGGYVYGGAISYSIETFRSEIAEEGAGIYRVQVAAQAPLGNVYMNGPYSELSDPYVTASSNGIAIATGTTTITLGGAIAGLEAGDIVVKKDATTLEKDTDYILSPDLSGTTFDITFLASAALNRESEVTVEMAKDGYAINGGSAITVENTIPEASTVTFDSKGGSSVEAVKVEYGSTITLPEAPTKEGYSFGGWFIDETFTDEFTESTEVKGDIILYAQWTVNQYTITFDSDGGSSVAPITLDYGAAVTASADPTKEGYTFTGWNPALPETMPANDLTITAQWTIDTYIITYNLDGGTNDDSNPATYTVNDEVALVPASKTGYTFVGWFDQESGGSKVETILTGSTGDITLYARYEINSYQVIFKDSDGEQIGETQTVTHGSKVSAPVAPDVPDGYAGDWYQLAEGNATPFDFDAPITEAMEIAFVINVTVEKAFKLVQGELDKAPENAWQKQADGLKYANIVVDEINKNISIEAYDQSVTLIEVLTGQAPCEGNPVDLGTLMGLFDGTTELAPGIQLILNAIEESGAKYFRVPIHSDLPSWFYPELAKFDEMFAKGKSPYFSGEIIEINDEDMTLKLIAAVYGRAVANLAQNGEWATDPGATAMAMRLIQGSLADMMIGNYPIEFYGDINGEPVIITQEPVILEFVEAPYFEISFDSQGGTEVESIYSDYGMPIYEPIAPVKAGYSFKGWYDEILINKFIFTTMPAENITLYAKWEEVTPWDGIAKEVLTLRNSNNVNSESNPYIIDTPAKLAYFSDNYFTYKDAYIEVINDLDLNKKAWTPIEGFSGQFNGNEHIIKGLKITKHDKGVGLFAYSNKATINNLTLEDPVINGGNNLGVLVGADTSSNFDNIHVINPTISSDWWSGGIVGYGSGTTITSSSVTGGIMHAYDWVAGGIIAGGPNLEIRNSSVIGTEINSWPTGYENRVGGIVGNVYAGNTVIDNCIFDGEILANNTVAGGVVGMAAGVVDISNTKVFGNISGQSQIGGIVGKSDTSEPMTINIINTINFASIEAPSLYGGFIGDGTPGTATIINSSNVGDIVGTEFENQIIGSGTANYTTTDVFPEIISMSEGNVDDIQVINTPEGHFFRGKLEVGLSESFIIEFATRPNLDIYFDGELLVEGDDYTIVGNEITVSSLPAEGVHKLIFITREADSNLNASLVVTMAPFATMPELTLNYDDQTIDLNKNNNIQLTNYDDGSNREYVVTIGTPDSLTAISAEIAPSIYKIEDYYDSDNERYVFPADEFKERITVRFIASKVGFEDRIIQFSLNYSPFSGGLGTAASPAMISRPEQIQAMKNDSHYQLINDLDFTAITEWDSFGVGRFVLDGQDYKIKGFAPKVSGSHHGLIGWVYGASTIKNLYIEDVNLSSPNTYDNGTLVGRVMADEKTHLLIDNVHVTGSIIGGDWTGGFVGSVFNHVNITNSSIDMNISGEEDVGGFIGYINTSKDGYSEKDSVPHITISNSVIKGKVSGTSNVGGAIGYNEDFTNDINNVISYTEVNAYNDYAAGLVGRGSEESTYSNNTIASRINCSGSNINIISNLGDFKVEHATIPEIISLSSGQLTDILTNTIKGIEYHRYLSLKDDVNSLSVQFDLAADLSKMDIYLDGIKLESSNYDLVDNLFTIDFVYGVHDLLLVFNEAGKENTSVYVAIKPEIEDYSISLEYEYTDFNDSSLKAGTISLTEDALFEQLVNTEGNYSLSIQNADSLADTRVTANGTEIFADETGKYVFDTFSDSLRIQIAIYKANYATIYRNVYVKVDLPLHEGIASEEFTNFVNDEIYPWLYDDQISDRIAFYPTNQGIDNSTSAFTTEFTGSGAVYFDLKTSSEYNWDYLKVYVDGALAKDFRVNTDWSVKSVEVTTEGIHTLKFEYKKDSSGNSGEDKVWVANIRLDNTDKKFILNYDTAKGSVSGTVNGTDTTFVLGESGNEILAGAKLVLTASPFENMEFVGWYDGANDKWLTGDGETAANRTYTFNILNDTKIEAVFKPIAFMPEVYLDHESETQITLSDGDLVVREEGIDGSEYIISFGENSIGSTITVKANGVVISPDVDENYKLNINSNTHVEIASRKEDCFSTYFEFDIKVLKLLSDLVNENYTDGIEVANDLDYPFILDASISDRTAYKSTNGGNAYTAGLIKATVTVADENALFNFDYKVSTVDRYSYGLLVVYRDTNHGNSYSKSETYASEIRGNFTGAQDWNTYGISLPKGTHDIYIGYYRGYTSSSYDYLDDSIWLSNFRSDSSTKKLVVDHLEAEGTIATKVNGVSKELVYGGEGNDLGVGAEVSLTAEAATGYEFLGWTLGTGDIVSYDNIYSFDLLADMTVSPVFFEKGSVSARIGGTLYTTLEDALTAAQTGDSIILLDDYTLTTNAAVPTGVTLMLPYDRTSDADNPTEIGTTATATGRVSWTNEEKYLFRTLTIAEGVSLDISGNLIVGGVQHYPAQNYQGHTSGAYAQIINNGRINVNNGGSLDLYGLLKGDGHVTAYSGSTIYQPFMIADYAGGTNTQALFGVNQTPFKRYAMVNIQNSFEMYHGSTMQGRTSLYFWSSITTHTQEIIGPNGLIRLSEGARLSATYDKDKYIVYGTAGNNLNSDVGKTTITINGGARAGYMQFPLGINTADVYFSIPYNFDLILENGTYHIDYGYKLMPGANMWVKSDATLQINSGLYVYDGLVQSDMSGHSYPSTEILTSKGFNPNSNLVVDGTMIVKSGATFGGIVQTNGTGTITVESGAVADNPVVIDGGVTGYDVNIAKFALDGRIYDSSSLISLEAGHTYTGAVGEWILDSFTVKYAQNSTSADYDPDILGGSSYHKWVTETITIDQGMKGTWVKQ